MIYFDNSATTKILKAVQDSQIAVQEKFFANPSSLHELGMKSRSVLNKAKEQIAQLLRIKPEEIIFTSGGTESNNTAILGTIFEKRIYGNHIITTQIEHPSVMNTMKFLERLGYEVTYLPVDVHGVVKVNDVVEAIRDTTILVSIMWVNNEVGSIQPIEEIGEILNEYPNIHFHVDAVQAVELVLKKGIHSRVDLLSLSAHKFHGPRGIGLLFRRFNRKIRPLLHGGGQEQNYRSGTENLSGIVGMAKALRIYSENQADVGCLKDELVNYLKVFEKVTIFSTESGIRHILTFAIQGVRGEVLVHALEKYNIYISTTSACSSKVKKEHHTLGAMKVPSDLSECAVRLSLCQYNTIEEIEQFKQVFDEVYQSFLKIN